MDIASPLILLVDDYEDARETCAEWLVFNGYRVVVTVDTISAIAAAHLHRPDVIVVDVSISARAAADAIRWLRDDPQLASTPMAAVTTHDLPEERATLFAAGFDAVLSKPVFPDRLLREIKRLLKEVSQ